MSQEREPVVEFRVAASEFVSALRGLAPARPRGKGAATDLMVRVSAALDRGEVGLPGATVRFDAEVVSGGGALVPWGVIELARNAVKSRAAATVRVYARDGCFGLEGSSWRSDKIRVVEPQPRRPVFSIGATIPEIIAEGRAHTAEELDSWGMLKQYRDAEEDARSRISAAAHSLEPLGVRIAQIETLVETVIQSYSSSRQGR